MLGVNNGGRRWPLLLFVIALATGWVILAQGGVAEAAPQPAVCSAVNLAGGAAGCYPDGTVLVATDGSVVYRVLGDSFYLVPDAREINACLGGQGAVRPMTTVEFQLMSQLYHYGGEFNCPYPLDYPARTLMQGPGPGVWLLDQGTRWGVPDEQTLNCWGGWGAVRHVSDAEFQQMQREYPDGGMLPHCGPPPGDERAAGSVAWAQQQIGKSTLPDGWSANGYCDHFVALAYGMPNSGHNNAIEHYQWNDARGYIHHGDWSAPYGSFVFYKSNVPEGHVAISLGDGRVISTGSVVYIANIGDFKDYLGWAWADPGYPGR